MVGFRYLDGVGIAPVSKKPAVKSTFKCLFWVNYLHYVFLSVHLKRNIYISVIFCKLYKYLSVHPFLIHNKDCTSIRANIAQKLRVMRNGNILSRSLYHCGKLPSILGKNQFAVRWKT